jgi:mitogen-activated protein kinase 7
MADDQKPFPWRPFPNPRDGFGRRCFTSPSQTGHEFVTFDGWLVNKELGQGAYGIVCAARIQKEFWEDTIDDRTKKPYYPNSVAIKKVTNVFSKKILAKRALREIKLLEHFRGIRNITCLYGMDIPKPDNFNEVYLYEELMECDLAAIIRSGQPLTYQHHQSFISQILHGLRYIHDANVLHRDLKPGNLLVNADCDLKICDFGLARGFSVDPEENAGYMTEYVATRWYRAPEIMLSFQSYTKAIDIWSIGCILAELLGGRPFFKGRDYVDQLNQILHILGSPDEETLMRIGSPRAREYVRNLPYMAKKSWIRLFPHPAQPPISTNPNKSPAEIEEERHNYAAWVNAVEEHDRGLDLLDKLLTFDPTRRITCEQALEHPYLRDWRESDDPYVPPPAFNFDFEVVEDMGELRKMILDEVIRFDSSQVAGRTRPKHPLHLAMTGEHGLRLRPEEAHHSLTAEDARPHEYHYGGYGGDLEAELAAGMDYRMRG